MVEWIEERTGRACRVRPADGTTIGCDLVAVGIGIILRVEPLRQAGATGIDGIDIDAACSTSLQHAYAVGDTIVSNMPDGDPNIPIAWRPTWLPHIDRGQMLADGAGFTYHECVTQRQDPVRVSARARQDVALKPEIARMFAENFAVYGVRKVWRRIRREGFAVARCTVERLMREMGLAGVIRGNPMRTTISEKRNRCSRDHVSRQFYAPAPNMLWVSEFTYIATWAGFVYVAFVFDTYASAARRLAGQQDSACQLRPRCARAGASRSPTVTVAA